MEGTSGARVAPPQQITPKHGSGIGHPHNEPFDGRLQESWGGSPLGGSFGVPPASLPHPDTPTMASPEMSLDYAGMWESSHYGSQQVPASNDPAVVELGLPSTSQVRSATLRSRIEEEIREHVASIMREYSERQRNVTPPVSSDFGADVSADKIPQLSWSVTSRLLKLQGNLRALAQDQAAAE